ncbi:MAG TPA: pyridoxamine 5'-phosphate oxidase family protein [Actinomycetota bacterium]|nr:pyridoxamine 5'-phosphate oxidase family protein [Actinomycetota bacterium]
MGTRTVTWRGFADAEPELAAFGAGLLMMPPAYLATIRRDGSPRVHPVTPILTSEGLFVFMEPTSPKGRDLRERGRFSLHNGVPDTEGSGGEFSVSGAGVPVEDPAVRATVAEAASYDPADRYVLFELRVAEARCNGYGDVSLPAQRRWSTEP